MRTLTLGLVALCSTSFAVDFPALETKIHNESGVDLNSLTAVVSIECDDPKTKSCGKAEVKGTWDPATSVLKIPAATVGPKIGEGGYFASGWGKYYRYKMTVEIPGLKDHGVADDLEYWSWEGRPGNSTKQMVEDISTHLKDLTVYAASKPYSLVVPGGAKYSESNVRLRYQKQFESVTDHFSDVGKTWLLVTVPKQDAAAKLAFTLPPLVFLLRGTPKDYGGAKPKVRTVVDLYQEQTRDGQKGFAFEGRADEAGVFEGEHFSKAGVEVKLNKDQRFEDE